MKKLLNLFILASIFSFLDATIIEIDNLAPFEKEIAFVDQDTLVLFDVDETLIMPKDRILNYYASEAWQNLAKETIKNSAILSHEQYDRKYIRSQILSKAEFEIVNPKFYEIVQDLQKQDIKTIAFTKMSTGPFGMIPLMEDWRIEGLRILQLDFSAAFQDLTVKLLEKKEKYSLFKQGVLFAGRNSKGKVLLAFLKQLDWQPKKILFVDNHPSHLESVELTLEGSGIEFIGFHYKEVEARPLQIDEEIARFQMIHLVQAGEWLSDLEAAQIKETESFSQATEQVVVATEESSTNY